MNVIRDPRAIWLAAQSLSPRKAMISLLAGLVWSQLAVLFGFCGTGTAQNFTTGFPIAGQNPYTAPIITVLDHSADYFYNPYHHSVVAYTGEMGKDKCSPSGVLNGTPPCGYYNGAYSSTNPVQFIANGSYVGTSADSHYALNVLNYRGHSGYDYAYGQGTVVVAAADGDLYVPASDPVNNPAGAYDPYCDYHTFYIYHGNGWTTWYLHTFKITVGSFSSSPHGKCPGLEPAGTYGTSDTFVAHVYKGEAVATVGDWADGYAGGVGYHLHFEVRRGCDISAGITEGCMVTDPYGWEWDKGDTIGQIRCLDSQIICATAQAVPLWELSDWGVQQPIVTNVTLTGSSSSYTATISGQNFSTSPPAQVTLWDQNNQYWAATLPSSAITSLSSTQIVAQLSISTPSNYALKVRNPNGPRSTAIQLGVSSPISSVPLVLDGQPAPGGGTIVSFGGFESFNNRSEAIVSAGIDTNGDGIADYFSDFQYSGGTVGILTAPGFTTISNSDIHVLRNNNGDIAFANIPNGEPVDSIWVLPSGVSSATQIIESGSACPSPCPLSGAQIIYRLFGPLAFDDAGDVAFETSLFNIQTGVGTCCFLFAYYSSDGSIVKVASDIDATPIGGTFDFVEGYPVTEFTADGDAIFESQISGGTSSGGIFRFSRTQGMSKLVAQGDNAPSLIGGTLGYPEFGAVGAVSGRQLVFDAPVSGGVANQFIGVIKDVTVSSPSPIIVAYQGEQTQTVALGNFSYQYNSSYLPFGHYGTEMPWTRSDGQVVFYSNLSGAVASTGASESRGYLHLERNWFPEDCR